MASRKRFKQAIELHSRMLVEDIVIQDYLSGYQQQDQISDLYAQAILLNQNTIVAASGKHIKASGKTAKSYFGQLWAQYHAGFDTIQQQLLQMAKQAS